jgi:hypothetical protein
MKKMIERVVFCNWLLFLARLPAYPYNWLMQARMNFIGYGDCLTSRKEYENRSN